MAITKGELKGILMGVAGVVGSWFVVVYFKDLITTKYDNPIILLFIGIGILLLMAYYRKK